MINLDEARIKLSTADQKWERLTFANEYGSVGSTAEPTNLQYCVQLMAAKMEVGLERGGDKRTLHGAVCATHSHQYWV